MTYMRTLVAALEDRVDAEVIAYRRRELTSLTGGDVLRLAYRMARVLRGRGASRGKGILWIIGNTPEVVSGRLATNLLGCRFVGLPTFFPSASLARFAELARGDLLVFDPRLAAYAAAVRERCPGLDVLSLGPSTSADDLLALAARESADPVQFDDDPSTLGVVRFTSGSTGEPKGVIWNFQTLTAFGAAFQVAYGPPPWRQLVFHPLGDIGLELLLPTLVGGGTVILVDEADSPARQLAALERERATHFFVPPARIRQLCLEPAAQTTDLSALRCVLYAGAPMSVAHIREAQEVFGPVLVQLYGQSEATAVSLLTARDHLAGDERLASVGRPFDGVEVVIRGEDGQPLPPGEVGEVCIRSGMVMGGYWGQPELTASVLRDGWLHTMDLGFLDADGYLHLSGRMRDVIIRHGFKIYAKDIEDALARHPAVRDAAVIPVPDPETGEAIWAAVTLRQGMTCDAATLRDAVADDLGLWQAPKHVHFMDELPRTGELNKPDKPALGALARQSLPTEERV